MDQIWIKQEPTDEVEEEEPVCSEQTTLKVDIKEESEPDNPRSETGDTVASSPASEPGTPLQDQGSLSVVPCPHCGRMFTSQRNFRRHLHSCHRKKKPHFCPFPQCSQVYFMTTEELARHRVLVHVVEGPFRCDECKIDFRNKESYAAHQKQHMHKRYRCTFCGQSFTYRAHLNIHINRVHPSPKAPVIAPQAEQVDLTLRQKLKDKLVAMAQLATLRPPAKEPEEPDQTNQLSQ